MNLLYICILFWLQLGRDLSNIAYKDKNKTEKTVKIVVIKVRQYDSCVSKPIAYFIILKNFSFLSLMSDDFIFLIFMVRPNTSPSILLSEITTDRQASNVMPSLR